MAGQQQGPTESQVRDAISLATYFAGGTDPSPVSHDGQAGKAGFSSDYYAPVFGAVDERFFGQEGQGQASSSERGQAAQQQHRTRDGEERSSLPSYQTFYQSGHVAGLGLGDGQHPAPDQDMTDIVVPEDRLNDYPPSAPAPVGQDQAASTSDRPVRSGSPGARVPAKEMPRPLSRSIPKTGRRQSKLSNLDRRQICEYADTHKSATQEDIAQKWCIDRSSVSKILKLRHKFLSINPNSRAAKVIKHRGGRFPQVEHQLVARLRAETEAAPDVFLNDKHIKDVAMQAANELGVSEGIFRASNGWLEAFKERASIKQGRFTEEDGVPGLFDAGGPGDSSKPTDAGPPVAGPSHDISALSYGENASSGPEASGSMAAGPSRAVRTTRARGARSSPGTSVAQGPSGGGPFPSSETRTSLALVRGGADPTNRAALASVDLEIAANYLNSDAGSVDAPSRSPGEAGLNQALGALERAVQHLENRPDVPHTAEEEVALRELLRQMCAVQKDQSADWLRRLTERHVDTADPIDPRIAALDAQARARR